MVGTAWVGAGTTGVLWVAVACGLWDRPGWLQQRHRQESGCREDKDHGRFQGQAF